MPRRLSEPARVYWAIGMAASLVLHASAVAGAALFADRYVRKMAPTEISFSGEASPTATPVSAATKVAATSATATVAKPEKLAPAKAETQPSEALRPVETDAARAAQQEALAPTAAEAAATQPADTVQPLDTDMAAAVRQDELAKLAAETQQAAEVAVAEALSSMEPETVESASAERPEAVAGSFGEAVQPSAASEALPGAEQDVATAISDSGSAAVSGDAERIASSTSPTASSSGEIAEKIAALEQQAAGGPVPALAADRPATTVTAERPSTESLGTSAIGTMLSAAGAQAEVLGPVSATQGNGAEQAIAVPGEQETVAPIEQPFETALLVPARPGSVLGTEIDKPSDRYRRIVDFVRQYAGGDCFIALPAMSPDGIVTFQTFGRDKAREDGFRKALLSFDGFKAEISSGDVADPQCMALSFARDVRRYPGFSLIIDLEEADVASGTRLSGSVLNAGGRELHLLVVDDEGRVQSLDHLLAAGDGTDRPFSAPLTLTGGPVVTKQVLIAIATNDRLSALADPVNEQASSYFRRLSDEIEATGADIDLAVEGFSVR